MLSVERQNKTPHGDLPMKYLSLFIAIAVTAAVLGVFTGYGFKMLLDAGWEFSNAKSVGYIVVGTLGLFLLAVVRCVMLWSGWGRRHIQTHIPKRACIIWLNRSSSSKCSCCSRSLVALRSLGFSNCRPTLQYLWVTRSISPHSCVK